MHLPHKCLSIALCAILFASTTPLTLADTSSNDQYNMDLQFVTPIPSPSPPAQASSQERFPNITEGKDFLIRKGYDEREAIEPFRLSVTPNLIDFGQISPTNPLTRTLVLRAHSGMDYGYSVFQYENHLLQGKTASIPSTTCDNASCSRDIAASWVSTLTYGLGYRCDAMTKDVCSNQFANDYFYEQIPSFSEMTPIFETYGQTSQAIITFKLNISGVQAPENYKNSITYLAVPTY